MNTHYLKYLTIPIVVCIVSSIFLEINSILQTLWAGYEYEFNMRISLFSFLFNFLTLFVAALIFSIAYKQTDLSLKNIIYIIAISIALILQTFIIFLLIKGLNLLLMSSYDIITYQSMTMLVISFFDPLLTLLIVVGVNYLYARITKLTITPMSNKLIALLYTALFISFSLIQSLINNSNNFSHIEFSSSLIIFMVSINIVSLIIFFIYCYTWSSQLLATKNKTNDPIRVTLTFALTLIILLVICIVLAVILVLIFSSIKNKSQADGLLLCGTIGAYLFGIPLFLKLKNLSASSIYSCAHWLFYIIIFSIITYYMKGVFYQLDGSNLFYALAAIYGMTLFLISFSLYLFYTANKLAIHLMFKEKDSLNNQRIV